MALPSSLTLECGPAAGGLSSITVIPLQAGLYIPPAVNNVVPELQNVAEMSTLELAPGSASFEEPEDEDEHGIFYKPKLVLLFPKDRPVVQDWIREMAGRRCILIYTDNNKYSKLVGSVEFPLRFSSDLDTSRTIGGKNACTFTFQGERPAPAPYYIAGTMSVPDGGGSGAFSSAFS